MSSEYVNFKVSATDEAKYLPKLVNELAGEFILAPSLREKFSSMSSKELLIQIKKWHKEHKQFLNEVKEIYEKMWNKIGDKYIKEIEKVLNWKIKAKKTGYIAISLRANIAEVLGKKNCFFVASKKQQNPLDFLMLHELTHLYYSDVLTSLNLLDAYESPLMEGVDHLILFKTPIKKLFNSKTYEEENFVKNNPKFMKELEKAWEKRKNFKSFLEKAIEINKKFPDVTIW